MGCEGQSSVTCRVTSTSMSLPLHICLLSTLLEQRCASGEHALISAEGLCVGNVRKQVNSSSFSPHCSRTRSWKHCWGDTAQLFSISSLCRWGECVVLFFFFREWERDEKTVGVQGLILFECSNFFHWHSTKQRNTRLLRLQRQDQHRGEQNSAQFCLHPHSEQFC